MSSYKNLVLVVIIGLVPLIALATPPSLTNTSYNYADRLLTLTFDQNIESDYFAPEGFFLGIAPDYLIYTYPIKFDTTTVAVNNNVVQLSLCFTGINDSYESEAGTTYYTWGKQFITARLLEQNLPSTGIKIALHENAVFNLLGEGNTELNILNGINLQSTGSITAGASMISAVYYEADGVLKFNFSNPVQWDNIAEDRATVWYDTNGALHVTPGNGFLDTGEDRNSNGLLDLENNIFLEGTTIFDNQGDTLTLNENYVYPTTFLTLTDSSTLRFRLNSVDREYLSNMNSSALNLQAERWCFTNSAYYGNPPVTIPVTFTPNPNPLVSDSANYNLGTNELKIYFSSSIASGQTLIFGKIGFSYPGGLYALTGYSSGLGFFGSYFKFTVNIQDQQNIEELYYQYGASDIDIHLEPFLLMNVQFVYNIESTTDITFMPESGTNRAPVPDSSAYDALQNVLFIRFDLNISHTEENIWEEKIFLYSQGDTFDIVMQDILTGANNKELLLQLTDSCSANIEMGVNPGSIFLLMEPFAVLQTPKYNGNWAVTLNDSLEVNFVNDTCPSLPTIILYEEVNNCLIIECNKTLNPSSLSITGITYSGVQLSAQSIELVDPVTINYQLTPSCQTALLNLSTAQKINPTINIPASKFSSTTGVANPAMNNLTYGSNMSLYGGNYTLLAGWGKEFLVKNYERFPLADYNQMAFLRKAGTHCRLFVALDQLQPYSPNLNYIPVTQSDLDTVYNIIENSTPTNPALGAFSAVRNIVDRNYYSPIPNQADILITDILDEYNRGYNDSNSSLFWGCRYEPEMSNGEELLLLDSYPQLFHWADSAWYRVSYSGIWYQVSSTYRTVDNAVVNLLSRWMSRYVDEDEELWVIEGLSSICEQLIAGDVTFYGTNSLVRTPNYSLTYIGDLYYNRNSIINTYLFLEYLHEKYGGEEIIQYISENAESGIAGINSALTLFRNVNILPEPFQSRTLPGIFLDYGTACLIDNTNGNDSGRFNFENPLVSLSPQMLYTNPTYLVWEPQNPPPYYGTMQTWSYRHFCTTYYPPGSTNPLLNPQGNLYYNGWDEGEFGIYGIRMQCDFSTPMNDQFTAEEIVLDLNNNGSTALSIPDWNFGSGTNDYHTHFEVVVNTGEEYTSLVFNNTTEYFFPPSAEAHSVSENSIRIDIDLPWGEIGFGDQIDSLEGEKQVKFIQSHRQLWLKELMLDNTDNTSTLAGFNIYRSTDPDTNFALIVSGLDTLVYMDTGLLEGRTYYYRVNASYTNPTGTSAYDTCSARPASLQYQSNFISAVSNFGNYGEPNQSLPSGEWPNGSGKYYIWEGRFWAGAEVNGEKLVSHADYGNYEWEPSDNSIKAYTLLGIDNFIYNTSYHDLGTYGGHTPIGLVVDQSTRMWTMSENEVAANSMLIEIEMENLGLRGDLHDVYIAWVFDCDIAAGPGGDPDQANIDDYVGYDRERNMSYMFDADDPSTPEDDTGEFGTIPGYIGLRLLTTPNGVGAAHHAWWNWNNDPGTDEEKYSFMDGTHYTYYGCQYMQDPWLVGAPVFDYRFLLSIGPFDLPVGERLSASAVLLVGDGYADLQQKSDSLYTLLGGTVSGVLVPSNSTLPTTFNLYQNYPNPFNPVTTFNFDVPKTCEVEVMVFNLLGQNVAKLTHQQYAAGNYSLHWDATDFASGLYFIHLKTEDYQKTIKVILMR